MSDGMRGVKIAAVVMGVLIVLGTVGLVVGIVMRRPPPPPPALPPKVAVVLDEPEGTHITGVATVQDRVAVALQGGGADRVVLVDPRTGAVTGQITLGH